MFNVNHFWVRDEASKYEIRWNAECNHESKQKKKHESKFNELSEKEDRNDFGQRLPLQDEQKGIVQMSKNVCWSFF